MRISLKPKADDRGGQEPTKVVQGPTEGPFGGGPGNVGPDSQLAVREDKKLVEYEYQQTADFEGEITDQDSIRPVMAIVAKTGDRSDLFTPGDILLNNEYVIGSTKQPLEIGAVIKTKKRYQNDIAYAPGGEFGETVDRAHDIFKRGGILEYRPFEDKVSKHFWMPLLQILWVVKQPENVGPEVAALFPFDINGVNYSVVAFTARTKTAFNGVGKILLDAQKKRGTVRELAYRLSTKGESWQDRSWIQANLRATGPADKDVATFAAEYL